MTCFMRILLANDKDIVNHNIGLKAAMAESLHFAHGCTRTYMYILATIGKWSNFSSFINNLFLYE